MNESIILRVSGKSIAISNPDKILFPKSKITKLKLVEYYRAIAPFMLPHIKDRPISMHRFPDGISSEGFFQKEASEYFPSWIKIEPLKKEGGTVHHVICNNAATLTYLATQACITPHIWLSTYQKPTKPNRIVFDLDPPDDNFALVKECARQLRALLENNKLTSYIMTTGSKGLHVVVPIQQIYDVDFIRAYAAEIAEKLVQQYPQKFTTEMRKEARKNKLLIDVIRNSYAHTTVAPYALRALPGAPVATPLSWDELGRCKSAQAFTMKNIFRRLGARECPWKGMEQQKQSLKT